MGGYQIQEFSADEIYTKKGLKPIVCLAETGAGKSFMTADIFRACLNAGFN